MQTGKVTHITNLSTHHEELRYVEHRRWGQVKYAYRGILASADAQAEQGKMHLKLQELIKRWMEIEEKEIDR